MLKFYDAVCGTSVPTLVIQVQEKTTRVIPHSEANKSAFLWYLVDGLSKSQYDDEENIPNAIQLINERQDYYIDEYQKFVDECMDLTDSETDIVKADLLYEVFCRWYKEYGMMKTTPNRTVFGTKVKKYIYSTLQKYQDEGKLYKPKIRDYLKVKIKQQWIGEISTF